MRHKNLYTKDKNKNVDKNTDFSFFCLQILKSLYPSPIEDPIKVQPLIYTGVDMKLKCMDSNTTDRYFEKIKLAKICITIGINF